MVFYENHINGLLLRVALQSQYLDSSAIIFMELIIDS